MFRAKDLSEDPPMECAAKQVSSASGMGEAELRKEVELMRRRCGARLGGADSVKM